MATLIATVRRMTGAVIGDVPDADVTAALDAHRVREVETELVWERVLSAGDVVFTRAKAGVWGVVEPSTQATASTNLVSVAQLDGTAATGNWTLEQDGTVVFAADQAAATGLYLSAYSYDLNAACADVLEQLATLSAGDYTVKLGDQTFNRGEGVDRLLAMAASFRRKQLPARGSMMLTRMDEEASPVRRRRRAGWR